MSLGCSLALSLGIRGHRLHRGLDCLEIAAVQPVHPLEARLDKGILSFDCGGPVAAQGELLEQLDVVRHLLAYKLKPEASEIALCLKYRRRHPLVVAGCIRGRPLPEREPQR
jgi:hypothetical protein